MSSDSFTFIVRIPDKDPVRHDLDGETKTLGRGPDADIQVLVSEVSVKHATLEPTENGYKIVDQGSTNGTKVNDQPVGEGGSELGGKDKVLLGAMVPAYFVATSELESSSMDEVIQAIEGASTAAPETAPVAQAAPAQPAAAQAPSDGATTVKLDQVQPSTPGGGAAKPPPAAPAPGGAKPPPAAPGGAKPPAVQPSAPQPSAPQPAEPKPSEPQPSEPQPAEPQPAAPEQEQRQEGESGDAKPVAPVPMKKPGQEGGAPKPPPAPGGANPPPPPKPQE